MSQNIGNTEPNINSEPKKTEQKVQTCGIVMPIAAIDDCSKQHWSEVYDIIADAIQQAGFKDRLVSDSQSSGVIQKRIVQNLYDDPIVVCDVSAKNPNVMFELGMRLAFDKPTIIIKDDQTGYSFDTGVIEHLDYPRDLRYNTIIEFKKSLANKIKATYEVTKKGKDPHSFLQQFGHFEIAQLETTQISKEDFILKELQEIKHNQNELKTSQHSKTSKHGIDLKQLEDFAFGVALNAIDKGNYTDLNELEDTVEIALHSYIHSSGVEISSDLIKKKLNTIMLRLKATGYKQF